MFFTNTKRCSKCQVGLTEENSWKGRHICKACDYLQVKKWRKTHPLERKAIAKRHSDKYRTKEYQKTWKTTHLSQILLHRKERYWKVRAEIFNLLGNKCSGCGETDFYCLQIDHVENDGFKTKKNRGLSYLLRIKKEILAGSVKYQLLCANCNLKKKIALLPKIIGKSGLRTRKLREKIIKMLGSQCVGCGKTEKRILQVDHKEGDGSIERGGKCGGNIAYRTKLLKKLQEGVEGFQLLCANCNVKKAHLNGEYKQRRFVDPKKAKHVAFILH